MIYNILRCGQCGHFVVKSQTKANKWSCTICGFKQPTGRVYSSATKAKELRPLVQEYNMKRGEFEEEQRIKQIEVSDRADTFAERQTDLLAISTNDQFDWNVSLFSCLFAIACS